jgi:two-component system, LytTR family, response regulator
MSNILLHPALCENPDLLKTLFREIERLKSAITELQQPIYLQRMLVKVNGKLIVIQAESVDWIEAWGDYVRLHCGENIYIVRKKISEMELKMNPNHFCRIGRSAIVQIDKIMNLEPLNHGDYLITLQNSTQLNLSRNYRDRLNLLFIVSN